MSSYYEQQGGQVRLIPGAGTYLQDQAKAQSAYERAKAALGAQRQQKQIGAGLNKDYQVDPNAQYGGYQQMLQGQGSELMQANEQAQQRGFFGPGLGNQAESAMRYGHAVQNLGFKNSMMDYENAYQVGIGDLERMKQEADLYALQQAQQQAFSGGDFTEPGYDPSYDQGPYPGSEEPLYPEEGNLGMQLPPGFNAGPLWAPKPKPKPKPQPKPKPGRAGGGNARHHGSAPTPVRKPAAKPKPAPRRGGR